MDLLSVHRVAAVQGTQVTLYGQLAIHHWVLGHQIWLVEVVGVFHVSSSQTCGKTTTVSIDGGTIPDKP